MGRRRAAIAATSVGSKAVPVAGVASSIVPSRRLVEERIVYGDPLPERLSPERIRGAIVKVDVVVPEDRRSRWESEGGIDEVRDALSGAEFAYPPTVKLVGGAEDEERRVVRSVDPEAALREHVGNLGLPEGDAALVIQEGLSILEECGLT